MAPPRFARPPQPAQPARRAGNATLARVAPLPRWLNSGTPHGLRGEFARAAYAGAVAAASRLTMDRRIPVDLLLTDLYISASHGLPYTVGDAAAATGLNLDRASVLVTDLADADALRVYRRCGEDKALAPYHRIELTPAKRAELGGQFAREAPAPPFSAPLSSDLSPDLPAPDLPSPAPASTIAAGPHREGKSHG